MRSLFINRNYTLFMVGSFVSATGSWIQSVALGWLVLDLGDSAFLLGLVGFARMIPLLVLSFPAGALADRFDRRRMLIVSQWGATFTAAPLAVATALDLASIPLIVVLALLAGVFDAFAWPVWSVFIKDLVGAERLRTAVAVNSTRFNLTRILGPAIGGVLLASYGTTLCFAVSAVCSIGVVASCLLIRLPPYPRRDPGPWLPAMSAGLRYAAGEPEVRRLLLITTGIGLFALPYQQLLPAVARDSLRTGPEGLGLLMTSVGVGAIVGAILSGVGPVQRNAPRLVLVLPIALGASVAALGLAPSMPLAMVALAAVGLCSIGFMSLANANIQLAAREELVGRVMGLWTVVQAGMMPLGSLGLGALGDLVGLPATLTFAGLATALVALVLGRRRRALPAAEGHQGGADAEEQDGGRHVGRALEVGRPAR
jgi:MFS family permease